MAFEGVQQRATPMFLVDPETGLPYKGSPSSGSITKVDISAAIDLGGTAQTLFAANAEGTMFEIQNTSDEDMWFDETGEPAVAASPSFKIAANGGYYISDYPIATAVSIIGATTGKAFTARKW